MGGDTLATSLESIGALQRAIYDPSEVSYLKDGFGVCELLGGLTYFSPALDMLDRQKEVLGLHIAHWFDGCAVVPIQGIHDEDLIRERLTVMEQEVYSEVETHDDFSSIYPFGLKHLQFSIDVPQFAYVLDPYNVTIDRPLVFCHTPKWYVKCRSFMVESGYDLEMLTESATNTAFVRVGEQIAVNITPVDLHIDVTNYILGSNSFYSFSRYKMEQFLKDPISRRRVAVLRSIRGGNVSQPREYVL